LEGEGNPQRLMCGIAGGVPPEVVEYDRFAICQWAARGAFLDLRSLIEADRRKLEGAKAKLAQLRTEAGKSPGIGNAIRQQEADIEQQERYQVRSEDFFEPAWNECKYHDGLFGIPNYMDDRVLYYNDDMLVQAGLTDARGDPKPPDTWEQIL